MTGIHQYIVSDPNIRFGKPCIKGTRITVGDILSWMASGMSMEEIISDFPELKKESIYAALAFAARKQDMITYVI